MLLQKWSNIFHDDNTVCLPPVHNYHVLEKTSVCRLPTTSMFWKKPASAACPQLPMFWKKPASTDRLNFRHIYCKERHNNICEFIICREYFRPHVRFKDCQNIKEKPARFKIRDKTFTFIMIYHLVQLG